MTFIYYTTPVHIYSMKRQNETKLLQLSTTIQNNLQKLMSSTFQRTLHENSVIKTEVNNISQFGHIYLHLLFL